MSDTTLNSNKVEVAKLHKRYDGCYIWRGWAVVPAKYVPDTVLRGNRGYCVTHVEERVFFIGETLNYVRKQLLHVDKELAALTRAGSNDVPKGCYKTEERKETERAERSIPQKITDANKEVKRFLQNQLKDSEKAKKTFLNRVENSSLDDAVRWGQAAVMGAIMASMCETILSVPDYQLPQAIARSRKVNAFLLLDNTVTAVSSGALHRAVDTIHREAVKQYVKLCDTCLLVYRREGVDLDDYLV